MLALLLSTLAQAAPTQPLFVLLHDVDASALVAEHGPGEADAAAPLAWSTVGAYTVGAAYAFRDGEGAVVLECTVRSFELRPAHEGGGEELWATLDCPVGQTAAL